MPAKINIRIAYFACLLLLCTQLLSFLSVEKDHGLALGQLPFVGDFNHYYATALMISQGQSPYCKSLADLPLPAQIRWHTNLPQATNPPLLALSTLPLAWTNIESAWLCWQLFLLSSIIAALLLLAREQQWSKVELSAILLLFLISSPSIQNFRFGQVQPFLLLLTVLGWQALRHKREYLSGLVWGLAIALKFYLWPLGVVCLLLGKRKAVLAIGLVFVAASALPALLFGPQLYEEFANCAKPLIEKSALIFPMNFSIGGIVQHTLYALQLPMLKTADWPFALWFYWLPLSIVTALLTFLTMRLRGHPAQLDLATGAAAALGILSAPVAWPHYFVFAGLLAVLCYSRTHPASTLLLLAAFVLFPYRLSVPSADMLTIERFWFAWRPLPTIALIAWALLLRMRTPGSLPKSQALG